MGPRHDQVPQGRDKALLSARGGGVWACPRCGRRFNRKSQRHACGTGGVDVLRGRPEPLAALYRSLEAFARSLGPIELVKRERYVLFRTGRIFADLVVMKDCLRAAVHLDRSVKDTLFFKSAQDRKRWSHVAKVRDEAGLARLLPYLREAYEISLSK